MKINAVIESKDGGTLVLDFPRSIYDVYEKLQSVGIRQSPHQVTLPMRMVMTCASNCIPMTRSVSTSS